MGSHSRVLTLLLSPGGTSTLAQISETAVVIPRIELYRYPRVRSSLRWQKEGQHLVCDSCRSEKDIDEDVTP